MNFKYFVFIFAGFTLISALRGAEPVFQGFGKPWEFYSGTACSKNLDAVSMPIKPGGMYIGVRQNLERGIYACSFEYKFREGASDKAQFQFSCSSTPSLHVYLTPNQKWTSIKFRIANTKGGKIKFGFGVIFPQNNVLELKNFRIEKLSVDDFGRLEYPVCRDLWFNRGSDRSNAVLSEEKADDHVFGGRMIQLKAKPEFKADGLLCLMTLGEPLPKEKKFRLSFWSKSDKEGMVRAAVSDHYHTYRIEPEWKKTSFEFSRKTDAKPTSNVSFQTLSKEIRTLIIKDVVIEMVKK